MVINNLVDIKPLTKIKIIEIPKDTIIFDKKMRNFCSKSYKGRKNGCPNFNNKNGCPPNSPYMEDFIMYGEFNYFYLIYGKLDFKKYKQIRFNQLIEKYKDDPIKKNKKYTQRELGNLLYWQKSMKNLIFKQIENIEKTNLDFYLLSCGAGYKDKNKRKLGKYSMESVGINVFETCKNNNITLERNRPFDVIHLICLLSFKQEPKKEDFIKY
jgi:predicted metal-binding protein